MNPRLVFMLGCLALPVIGQETATVDPVISSLLAQPEDAAKQRDILQLLPRFVGQTIDLETLARNMRLELLGAADCSLLARTALEIELVRKSNHVGTWPGQRGGFSS